MTEKRMTAEERARKIYKAITDRSPEESIVGLNVEYYIAEQIQLAVDEARAQASGKLEAKVLNDTYDEGYAKGFSDARERAAKVVDDSDSDEQKSAISESIRALQPEEK